MKFWCPILISRWR